MNEQMNLETVIQELKSLIKRASRERSGAFDGSYKLVVKVDHGGSIRYVRVQDGRPAKGSDLLVGIQLPQRDPLPDYIQKAGKECEEARAAFDKVDTIYQETIHNREREREQLRSQGAGLDYEIVKLRDHNLDIAAATQERESAWEGVVEANAAFHHASRRRQIEREEAEFAEQNRRDEAKKAEDLKRRRALLAPALARLRNRLRGNAAA